MKTVLNIPHLHRNVLHWYVRHQRPLPWRKTKDPYRILLSEIMAQQTQIVRVEAYYRKWIKKYPTIRHLTKAAKADILQTWSGLGYNNRGLRLLEAARIIVSDYAGKIPRSTEQLQALPGIGKYTAHAIACFAFLKNVPVVDINIRRILTRMTKKVVSSGELLADKDAWKLAETFLPSHDAYRWNQGLMDIGSMFCTAMNPACGECPLAGDCRSSGCAELYTAQKKDKTNEPSYKGIPRRIIRGKILRSLHGKKYTEQELLHSLRADAIELSRKDLTVILATMLDDGLIRYLKRGSAKRIAIAA